MTPERFQRIEAVFQKAVKLSPAERRSYLEMTCRGDAGLRAELESLLASDHSTGPLDGSALDHVNTNDLAAALDESRDDGGSPGSIRVDPPAAKEDPGREPGRTRSPVAGAGLDPVVGWLVCVQGPDRGRDYRIRSQRNGIGRGQHMDIHIAGDLRISREDHAVITYDPRGNQFRLSPGRAQGLTYLNRRLLDTPTVLRAFDVIELGETVLQFVPLCGEQFQWT